MDRWLGGLGLGEYATVFAESDIDWSVLPDLTERDLEALRVRIGHRKRLVRAIARLRKRTASLSRVRSHAGPHAGGGMRDAAGVRLLTPQHATERGSGTPQIEAERRQLTVMFCDMVGSTALAEKLDPEEMRDVLRSFHEYCAAAIAEYDGIVAQYLGDGSLAYFGYPQAHEEDAERAVRAGMSIVAAMDDLNRSLRVSNDVQIAVRVGIATGLVVVGNLLTDGSSRERTAIGETPNLAARLQSLAEPNTIVIAAATRGLLGERFEYEDLGAHDLKGFSKPVQAWRVIDRRELELDFDIPRLGQMTPFVNREAEVALLLDRWGLAREGEGQLILVSGEPGIGKSRIALALQDRIANEAHSVLRYHCSPFHRNSALHPVIEQISRAAGFERQDTDAQRLDKLERLLREIGIAHEKSVPLFAALMSIPTENRYPTVDMSPQRQKESTLAALLDAFETYAKRHPLLVVFQDVHWIDPTTREFLDLLVEHVPHLPILILVNFRPEFVPAWAGLQCATVLSLGRLNTKACTELVLRITHGKALPESVIDQFVSKTDGIPLFVEELTKTVLNSDLLEERTDSYVMNGPLPPRAIPSTIQDLLMARLDQLGVHKEVAQIGSVIGRQFSYELMAAITSQEEIVLQDALDSLVDFELVFSRGPLPDTVYTFKHALVRDAAYESLLLKKRKDLHGRIATTIESRFPDIMEANPQILAHHFCEAGQIPIAIHYWLKAAENASARSADVEASNHLHAGLDAIHGLPETPERKTLELQLRIPLGTALIAITGAGSPEVERNYARALDLCEDLPESPLHFAALWGWWRISMDFQTGRERADKLLELAESLADPDLRLQAHHCLWATTFNLGDQIATNRHIEEGLKLYDEHRHRSHASIYGGHDARVCAHGEAALALWLLGCPDQALARIRQAEASADAVSHAGSRLHAMDISVMLHHYLRDVERVREKAEAMIAFSEEKGFPDHLAKGDIFKGWADVLLGESETGLDELRKGITAQRAIGTKEDFPVYFDMMAEACKVLNQPERGLSELADGFALAETSGIHYWNAELHRRKGELLLAISADNAGEAEACYSKALEIAREHGTKSLELRSAISLGRLWQSQGRTEDARLLLSGVFDWFTEGADTPDLKEARDLLENLK